MNKQRQVMAQMAGIGLGVTAVFYFDFFLVRYLPRLIWELATDLLGLVSMVFCPASLTIVQPFAIYESPESVVGEPGAWVIVGIANSLSYAAIGYLAMRLAARASKYGAS